MVNTFIKKLKIIKKKIKNGDEIKFEEELDTVNIVFLEIILW